MALTHRAHQIIKHHFQQNPRRQAIDATCGNGHDTEFLLSLNFDKVLAFDVQQQALDNTRERIASYSQTRFDLIHANHQNMQQHISGKADCVMFNLGYLPNADKELTTHTDSTLLALNASTNILSCSGIISVLCYPGHTEGKLETDAVQQWVNKLNDHWRVETFLSNAPKPTAPILILIQRNT